MSRVRLVGRLVARDLRHRPGQAILMLLAITAATTTLTLGLVLHGVTSHPYQQTRAATNGPDEVAYLGQPPVTGGPPGSPPPVTGTKLQQQAQAQAGKLARTPGVTASSGPFPLAGALIRANGLVAGVEAEGRDEAPAAVDQPKLTAGSWVRPGGVVLERTFAAGLGVGAGDRVTLNGRPFTVTGIAVTAANPPFPNLCYYSGGGCRAGPPDNGSARDIGLLWLTKPDALALATPSNPVTTYVVDLRLKNPATADAFALRYDRAFGPPEMNSWTGIAAADALLVQDEQQVLSPGAWLATLLAIASVAVLAGGRMTERTRRVGLLKAVGASPGLVTATLMAENLVLALAAAAVGLVAGMAGRAAADQPGRRPDRHPGRAVADRAGRRAGAGGGARGGAGRDARPRDPGRAQQHRRRPGRRAPAAAAPGRACSRCPGGCRCRCSSGCGWWPGGRGAPCSARPTSRSPWPASWPCSPSTPPPGRGSTAGAAACPTRSTTGTSRCCWCSRSRCSRWPR